ncbi:MAG: hypothetical protein WCX13_06695 [Candidatus Hydrogenedentales bacterium]
MKRAFLGAMCASFLAANAFAQIGLAGLAPKDARSMGMGGTFRVFATGYQAFFGNPSGFSGPGTFTLVDVATWGYFKPNPSNIKDLVDIAQGAASQTEAEETLDRLVADNGFGGGASVGLGWSGKGIGAGLTLISDALATGNSCSDASFMVRNQANAIFGMAWPLEFGAFKFSFGADVRAFYRLESADGWLFADVASALLSGQGCTTKIAALTMNGGYGLSVDTGATFSFGPLSAGVMIRDYGYKFYMDSANVGDIMATGSLPSNGNTAYRLVPVYTAGLGLNFGRGRPIASSFYIEADDPMNFISEMQVDFAGSMDLLHVGAELKILNFIALRAGFNEGLLAFGAGLDFALIEIDVAAFSETIPGVADGPGRSGVALQAAVRF